MHGNHFTPRHTATAVAALCMLAMLVGCFGGGGDDDEVPEPPVIQATMLRGVAATGAALAGATITVSDADAATTDPAPVTAQADGSYVVDVSALKTPLIVHAAGLVDGLPTALVAVVPVITAQADTRANVTPLTHAVAALIAPGGDPLALRTPATLGANASAQRVADATTVVVNTLATDPAIAAVLGSGFNPLTTPFSANGSGLDAVLDQLAVEVSSSGVALTNLSAPVTDGVPASVTLTPAALATPTQVPTLAPSAPAADLPTSAQLATLASEMQACLALPLATRATIAADGKVTAVDERCSPDIPDWRSNGRSWVEDVGQFLIGRAQMSNARAGKPLVVLTIAPARYTDPKVFKHPYCNEATCVIVRIPFTTESNQPVNTEWVTAKVGGEWKLVGNQRPYNVFVQPRMNRRIAVNRTLPVSAEDPNSYFFKDRFESTLRLIFDLRHGNTSDIRAVRFSGPGLPATGVVQYRSQRCGTDDRMAISNQVGSTRVLNSANFQFWTGGSATEFVLDAANLDGSPLALPVPDNNTFARQDFSSAPVANQATAAPAWSIYKVEIFRFAALSDEPDEVLFIRTGTAPENASAGAGKNWPTLDGGAIDAYLKPGGAMAGAITSLAPTLSFTIGAGAYVSSGYLFGQNVASATNAQNETANYVLRSRLDFLPARYGDLQISGFEFAGPSAGTSMSPSTANSGTNPNPRCGPTAIVPLTESTSDYREIGLGWRDQNRKFYNATWFWDN